MNIKDPPDPPRLTKAVSVTTSRTALRAPAPERRTAEEPLWRTKPPAPSSSLRLPYETRWSRSRAAAIALSNQGISIASNFLFGIALIHALSPTQYGTYS